MRFQKFSLVPTGVFKRTCVDGASVEVHMHSNARTSIEFGLKVCLEIQRLVIYTFGSLTSRLKKPQLIGRPLSVPFKNLRRFCKPAMAH